MVQLILALIVALSSLDYGIATQLLPFAAGFLLAGIIKAIFHVLLILNYSDEAGYAYFGIETLLYTGIGVAYSMQMYTLGMYFFSGIVFLGTLITLVAALTCWWFGIPERLLDDIEEEVKELERMIKESESEEKD